MKLDGCHEEQELTALTVDNEGGRILTGSRHGAVKVKKKLRSSFLHLCCC